MIYLIIFAGIVLRIISLNQSLWLDEATTAMVSKINVYDIFGKFLPGDFHPPLYYLLVKIWTAVFGSSEISLRLPSVILGVGLIYIVYLFTKKISGEKAALAAGVLTATSGLLIYYSQEARMYMPAAFLVALLFYLAQNKAPRPNGRGIFSQASSGAESLRSENSSLIHGFTPGVFAKWDKKWVLFSLFLAILGLTDYVALLILPVFWITYKDDYKKMLTAHLPLAGVFVFWLPVFLTQLGNGSSLAGSLWWQILGMPTLKNFALIPTKFILGRISFDSRILYGSIVIVSAAIYGLALLKAGKAKKYLWLWLFLPVFFGLILSFKIPALSYFRFLFCLPALYMLAGVGLSAKSRVNNLLLIFLIVINIFSSGIYLFNNKFHREDWRGAVSFVESQKDSKSITIFVADSNMEAYRYYAPNAKITGPLGIKSGYNQIWLMRYLKDVFDPQDLARKSVENLGYKKAREFDFNGVVIWEYIPNEKTYAYIN